METLTVLTTASQRLEALQAALGQSLASIQRAASILREMELAGDDLSAVPSHIIRTLRRINEKLLLPEVAVRFSGALREAIARLPLPLQATLIAPGATVAVTLPDGDTVEVPPDHLTTRQLRQVFGDGFIRQRAEQLTVMEKASSARRPGRQAGTTFVKVDKERSVVEYFGHTISKAQLVRWLNEL